MHKEYYEPTVAKQPEHLSVANDMANAILDSFSFSEQNEVLDHIRRRMIEDREKRRADLQMQLEETEQMLISLTSPRINH